MGIMIHTIQSFSGIGFNKYVFIRYLSGIGRGVLHTSQHVPGWLIICPWSWEFVGRMQYAPTRTIQSFPEIRFNKYLFIRYLFRICRGVLHTPQHVPGGSIICPWSWEFVGRMQHAPMQTIQSLSGIRFNKYVFMRYLSRIGSGVLHMTQNVSGGSIICLWSWIFVGRMQYATTRTIQYLPRIGFNKYVFIRYLYRIGMCVLHTPLNVPDGSIICPWLWEIVRRMQYATTRTI